MIVANTPIQSSQSRRICPQYRDISDPQFAKDWGRPVAMIPSKAVRCSLSLDISYDEKHAELVEKLLLAVGAINDAINEDAVSGSM